MSVCCASAGVRLVRSLQFFKRVSASVPHYSVRVRWGLDLTFPTSSAAEGSASAECQRIRAIATA